MIMMNTKKYNMTKVHRVNLFRLCFCRLSLSKYISQNCLYLIYLNNSKVVALELFCIFEMHKKYSFCILFECI